MNRIFEVNEQLASILSMKEVNEEAYADTIESIEMEIGYKMDEVASYIKGLQYEAKAIREEEKVLAERRKKKEGYAEELTLWLKDIMKKQGLKKIESTKNVVSIRATAGSLVIDNEEEVIDWASKYMEEMLKVETTIDKNKTKQLIKENVYIPYAKIVKGESITIK